MASDNGNPPFFPLAIPTDLVESVAASHCVLFIGAGASLPPLGYAGPPGPALLTVELIDRLGYAPDFISLPWAAQIYEQQFGRQSLLSHVAQLHQDSSFKPSAAHWLIGNLAQFTQIVSVAYDVLLDEVIGRTGRWRQPVIRPEDLGSYQDPYFIKLLGVASQPPTLCVTDEGFDSLFRQREEGVFSFVRGQCQHSVMLFIGFPFADPTFYRLLRELRPQAHGDHSRPSAYFVHPNLGKLDCEYLRSRGFVSINATPEVFLTQLWSSLSSDAAQVPSETIHSACFSRLPDDLLRRRTEQVSRVLRLMGLGGTVESSGTFRSGGQHLNLIRQLLNEYGEVGMKDEHAAAVQTDDLKMAQAQIYLQYGFAQWSAQEYDHARQYFEDALALAPNRTEAVWALHYLLGEMREMEASLGMYHRAITVEPSSDTVPPQYEVLAVLSMSASAMSYRVKDRQSDRMLSLKVFRTANGQDSETVEQVRSMLRKLEHPGIPRLVEIGHFRGRLFIVREFLEGTPVTNLLHGKPMPVMHALSLLTQTADILECAHRQGLFHLRLQPDALLVSGDNRVSVLRFGEAQLIEAFLQGRKMAPTANDYLSPEQRAGFSADGRSDVYALGTIAYEVMTGHVPGIGAFEAPSAVNTEVDEAVDILIRRSRALDPGQRFPDIGQMHRELRRIEQSYHPGGIVPATRWLLFRVSGGVEWLARSPVRVMVLLCLAVASILVEIWLPMPQVLAISRYFVLTITTVLSASYLSYWWTRETARKTGRGSLIHSGRGMGALFGVLLVAWYLRTLEYHSVPVGIDQLSPGPDFFAFLGITILFSLGASLLMLLLVHMGAFISDKLLQRYTVGFYGMFLLSCAVLALIAGFRFFRGTINVLGY